MKRSAVTESMRVLKRVHTEKDVPADDGSISSFSGAHSITLLNEDLSRKVAFVHMKIPTKQDDSVEDADAVVILERKPFSDVTKGIFTSDTKLSLNMKNDAYATYTTTLPMDYNLVKTTVICPATEKHIAKYTKQQAHIIVESESDYKEVTKPLLDKKILNLQWIYNILDGKAETDKVVFSDSDPEEGFVIVMDYKWDGKEPKSLYCQALPRRRDLMSIRDLRGENIPMLENIKNSAMKVFSDKYGVDWGSIKSYFHYHPSFYHLHIHFTNIELEIGGMDAWRAHLLDDVIENLKISSNYYQHKTLTFIAKDGTDISNEFQKVKNVKN